MSKSQGSKIQNKNLLIVCHAELVPATAVYIYVTYS